MHVFAITIILPWGVADSRRIFNFTDLHTGIGLIYACVCHCSCLVLMIMMFPNIYLRMLHKCAEKSGLIWVLQNMWTVSLLPTAHTIKPELCISFVCYYMAIGVRGVS